MRKSVAVRYIGILIELKIDGIVFKRLILFSTILYYPKFINLFDDN